MKKKKIASALTASSLAAISVLGLGAAAYAKDSSSDTIKKTPTAEQIARHEADRKARLDESLANAVDDGTITQEQATELLQFFEDNKPTISSELSFEERKALMDEFKEKLDDYAEDNNLNLEEILPAREGRGPGGPGGAPGDRKQHMEEKLDAAVADGTITQTQKEQILEFLEANKPSEADKDLSESERKAAMEERREEFEAFAEDNDIPVDVLRPGRPVTTQSS